MLRNPRIVWFGTLALGLALSTYAYGWWSVVVLAAAWSYIRRADPATPLLAGAAGMFSWALLLAWASFVGPVTTVADVVGTAMQVGAGPLMVLTLAFPALVAAATAGVVRGVLRSK